MKLVMTLIIIYDSEKVLLAMKKRSFGAGRWNGYGGKVSDGETIQEAAQRELTEESGVVAKDLEERGQLTFTFEENDTELEVHIFSVKEYEGEPLETEEMRPQWFAYEDIPYDQMWKDDQYWLPDFLKGKKVKGNFHFDNSDSQNILSKNIEFYD